jgi:hypothetical protein
MTPSHSSVLGHAREAGTTTTTTTTTTKGGVLRLLAPLEFSEDHCVG